MIPEFPEFKRLELSDRDVVENTTRQFPPYSDFNFTLMWCWNIHEPIEISLVNQNLLIRQSDSLSGELFYSLIGHDAINESINQISEYYDKKDNSIILKLLPEEVVAKTRDFSPFIIEDRNNHDYIYNVSKLQHATGKKFANYRNNINSFLKSFPDIISQKIDLSDIEMQNKMIALFHLWYKNKEDQNDCENVFELKALKKLLSEHESFKSIISLGLFIENELIAFNIIDLNLDGYAFIPFAKHNVDFKGAFHFLMRDTVNLLEGKKVTYINFEADYGIEQLRSFKLSYQPEKFLKKYIIEIRN